MSDVAARIQVFHRLHQHGCFVIPNPWDVGSARLLASLGFQALATTSSGLAWSLGRSDYGITLEQALAHFRELANVVELPVSADFQNGFADSPEGVAENVARAAETGIAGVSIEDSTGREDSPLYDRALAVERVRAARVAIDAGGRSLILTARAECFLVGRPDLNEVLDRLTAFADAGADCLYAPGLRSLHDIEAVVRAVAPKPVNVLAGGNFATVAQLSDIGVRRISVGGALARAAWTGAIAAAREIASEGTFVALGGAVSGVGMNRLFSSSD